MIDFSNCIMYLYYPPPINYSNEVRLLYLTAALARLSTMTFPRSAWGCLGITALGGKY